MGEGTAVRLRTQHVRALLNETERGSIPKKDIIVRQIDVAKLIIMQKARQDRFTISRMDFRVRIMHIRFHRRL